MDNRTVLQSCLLSNFHNLISIRLDNSNYVTWKFLVETMLAGCGLFGYIDGSFPCPPQEMMIEEGGVESVMAKEYKDWVQNDSAVSSILVATLSSDALSFVIGSKSSKEIWCRLKEKYVDDSRHNILNLQTSLYNIQKGSDCIDKYLLRVKSICDQLAVVGVNTPDEDLIEHVLHGLPSEFATIKAIIRIKTLSSSVSMRELRRLLLIAEDEIEQNVKSIFEKFKAELMAHGHSLNKYAPASVPAPSHVTNAKYVGGIQYNGAFNYGLSSLDMPTNSSCIDAPVDTSGYAHQPTMSQFFVAVSRQQNEEFKTELQNVKADWEQNVVDVAKHAEEQISTMEKEIHKLQYLLKRIQEEACGIKEEEAQLKDYMKKVECKVIFLQNMLAEERAENMKLRENILEKENEFQSIMHENEELQSREIVFHKKLEDLSKQLEAAPSKKQAEENVELTDSENSCDLLPKVVKFSEGSGHGREEKLEEKFPQTQCTEPQSRNLWIWTNVLNGKAKHVNSAPIDSLNGKLRGNGNKEKEDDSAMGVDVYDQIMNTVGTHNNQSSVSSWWSHLLSQLMWCVFFTFIVAVVVHMVMGWWKIGKCEYFGSGLLRMWNNHQEGYSYQLSNVTAIWVVGGLLGILFKQGIHAVLRAETLMKTVSDSFKKGMFEVQFQFRSIRQLESNHKYQKQKMTTNEACGLKMDSFPQVVNVTDLVSILQSNFDEGFPVGDHPSKGEKLAIGRMLHIHLLMFLQNFKLRLLCCSTLFICSKLMLGSLPSA